MTLSPEQLAAIRALPAETLAECAHGWKSTVRLVGNVEARDVAAIGEAVPALLAHVVALVEQRDEARRERDEFSYDSLTERMRKAESERDEAERRVAERIAAWLEKRHAPECCEPCSDAHAMDRHHAGQIRAGAWKENPDG